jgi:hypothetical protein
MMVIVIGVVKGIRKSGISNVFFVIKQSSFTWRFIISDIGIGMASNVGLA